MHRKKVNSIKRHKIDCIKAIAAGKQARLPGRLHFFDPDKGKEKGQRDHLYEAIIYLPLRDEEE